MNGGGDVGGPADQLARGRALSFSGVGPNPKCSRMERSR